MGLSEATTVLQETLAGSILEHSLYCMSMEIFIWTTAREPSHLVFKYGAFRS